jgi:hypothetical protein
MGKRGEKPPIAQIGEHTRLACQSLRPHDDELLREVREGGTPSAARETGVLPTNIAPAGRFVKMDNAFHVVFLFVPIRVSLFFYGIRGTKF